MGDDELNRNETKRNKIPKVGIHPSCPRNHGSSEPGASSALSYLHTLPTLPVRLSAAEGGSMGTYEEAWGRMGK